MFTILACLMAATGPPYEQPPSHDVPTLIKTVVDQRRSPEVRASAASVLVAAPGTNVAALFDALTSEIAHATNERLVSEFARVLSQSEQHAVEAFFRRGFSEEVSVRRNCILALRHLARSCAPSERLSELLMWYALDPDETVRAGAACALGEFSEQPAVTEELVRLSHDNAIAVRAATIETLALRKIDSTAVDRRLIQALDDPAPLVRAAAIRSFWKYQGPRENAINILASEIADSSPIVRRAVLQTLYGDLVANAPPPIMKSALTILVQGLSDRDVTVRAAAAHCAADSVWIDQATTLLPHLVPLVQEADEDVRESAVNALSRHIEDHPEALAAVRSRLNDETVAVRCSAIRELRVVVLQDEEAFRGVLAVLNDEDPAARRAAAWCLGQAAHRTGKRTLITELATALLRCLDDTDPEVRAIAVSKLTLLAASADRIQQALDRAVQDPVAEVRLAAFGSIFGGLEADYQVVAARAAVSDDDWRVRKASVGAVGASQYPSRVPILLKAAADRHPAVRSEALNYLARLQPPPIEAVGPAILCLDDSETFRDACSVLAAVGPPAQAAVAPLVAIAQRGEPDRKTAAVEALNRVCPASLRDIPEASAYLTAADYQAHQSSRKLMRVLAATATKSRDEGDFRNAVTLMKGAVEMGRSLVGDGAREAAIYQCHLAMLYLQIGEVSDAEQLMLTWGDLSDDATDLRLQLNRKVVSAGICLARGQADDALSLLRPFVEKPTASLPPDSLVTWQNLMAMYAVACLKCGRVKNAVQALELVIADRQGSPAGRSQAHFVLGQIHLAHGHYDAAEAQLASAIVEGLPTSKRMNPEILGLLGQIDAAKGRFSDASSKITQSRQAARQRLSEYLRAGPEEGAALHAIATDAHPFLRIMALVPLFPAGFAGESAAWVLNGKAGITEELCAAKWRLTEELTSRDTTKDPSDSGNSRFDEVRTRAAATPPTWLPLRVDRWVTCAEVRDVIPTGTLLVEFAIWPTLDTRGRWLRADFGAWLIPPRGDGPVECVRLGEYEAVLEAVLRVQKCIRQRTDDLGECRRNLSDLSQLILKPIEERLCRYRRWMLCPDGALWLAPWAALIMSDGRYVCEGHVVTTLGSGRFLLWPSHREESRGIVILADPELAARSGDSNQGHRQWVRLPGAEQEAKDVGAAVSAVFEDKVEAFFGQHASAFTLRSIHRPRLLYVATHAEVRGVSRTLNSAAYTGRLLDVVGSGEPHMPDDLAGALQPLSRSGLLLSSSGEGQATQSESGSFVSDREISKLDLRGTELVVVSACDSGFQAVAEIDVLDGLRNAFHVAGAANVITNLWPVSDAEAPRLMSNMFSNLAAGQEVAEALRTAQVTYAQSAVGDLSNPYYWAGWTVSGVPLDVRARQTVYYEHMGRSVSGAVVDVPVSIGALVAMLLSLLLTLTAIGMFLYRRRRHRSGEESLPSE